MKTDTEKLADALAEETRLANTNIREERDMWIIITIFAPVVVHLMTSDLVRSIAAEMVASVGGAP